jgi:hypothetical protein
MYIPSHMQIETIGSGVEEVTEPSAVILSAAKNLLL